LTKLAPMPCEAPVMTATFCSEAKIVLPMVGRATS
jgi:hypothetical protein